MLNYIDWESIKVCMIVIIGIIMLKGIVVIYDELLLLYRQRRRTKMINRRIERQERVAKRLKKEQESI